MEKLKSEFDLSLIVALSGSGQQHGSVWWMNGSSNLLESIENETDLNNKSLRSILGHSFSTSMSPIWMDASTTIECNEITESNFCFFL